MIPGLSGSLLSHDALDAAGLTEPEPGESISVRRDLARRSGILARTAGPAWSARQVFDEVATPLCAALHFAVVPTTSGHTAVHAYLMQQGREVAVIVTSAWGQDLAALWRDSVTRGIGAGLRWCFCCNGRALRVFDAVRTHSRRFLEVDLAQVATEPAGFAVVWRLLRAEAFASGSRASLDDAVLASEHHRTRVKDSLQRGVHDALTRLVAAFLHAGRRRADARGRVPLSEAYDESLIVVYRVLFLLFAEARGLVPNWHPVYRASYTVEALRVMVEAPLPPNGLWESLQAMARLAHRGCRAGALRVPAFNGRLFAPAHAPLAESLSLDDNRIRDALLALTTRQEKDGRRRIAYSDLGVEHLGGVYERVLDYEVTAGDGRTPVLVRGGRRKASGTFYTPRTLTEYVVRRTLAPLVENAGADEILRLKIVDPAMGSGAFLVAACRYLAHAYEAALIRECPLGPGDITEHERASFRRGVAQRCLYGVDFNPMAVQLARLSLWLATLCSDRPLTFFDHQLRAGNSLAGASIADARRGVSRAVGRPSSLPLFDAAGLERDLGSAVRSVTELREGPEDTLEHIRAKERLFGRLRSSANPLARWKRVLDLWCAAWFEDSIRRLRGGVFEALLDGRTLSASISRVLLDSAREIAQRERFFHWTLEFPEVFSGSEGQRGAGFDAVIGNPPWEVLRADSGPVESRRAAAADPTPLTRFTRRSGVYRLQGSGHPNLYQLFLERATSLVRPGGRIGLVLPSGFASDYGCTSLRRHLLDNTTVDSLVSVDNRDAIFPIHRGLKFLLLTSTAAGHTSGLPWSSGPRRAADFDRLPESGRDPEAVVLSRELLDRLSGDQLAIPDLRTQEDAALVARLAFAHPAAGDSQGWDLHFGRELNATDDRRHFRESAVGDALPVLEGKQIGPFTVAAERSRLFIDRRTAAELLPAEPFERRRLAYRDVASSSNRLTLIAAVIPAATVTTHTLFCLKTRVDEELAHFLCGMLNSFVANYLVRVRVTTHVSVAVMARLPLPKPSRDTADFALLASLARKLAHDPGDVAAAAEQQAAAARIYGLSTTEFAQVLSTFPLVSRAERDNAMSAWNRTL